MPRGGSRSRSSSAPRSSSFASRPQPTAQKPQTQPMQQQQSSGGFLSGIGSTIMTGMAFGAGSEVAHQAVRGVMGGSSHSQEQVDQHQMQNNQTNVRNQEHPCQQEIQSFSKCIETNSEISYCQSYSDMLRQCKERNNIF